MCSESGFLYFKWRFKKVRTNVYENSAVIFKVRVFAITLVHFAQGNENKSETFEKLSFLMYDGGY